MFASKLLPSDYSFHDIRFRRSVWSQAGLVDAQALATLINKVSAIAQYQESHLIHLTLLFTVCEQPCSVPLQRSPLRQYLLRGPVWQLLWPWAVRWLEYSPLIRADQHELRSRVLLSREHWDYDRGREPVR